MNRVVVNIADEGMPMRVRRIASSLINLDARIRRAEVLVLHDAGQQLIGIRILRRTALARVNAMRPDLIVLDLMLPLKPGLEVCRDLRGGARTKDIPIIMVTSKGQETDKIWGLRQGAVDYMVKPVSPDQLVAKAQAAVARVQARQPTSWP